MQESQKIRDTTQEVFCFFKKAVWQNLDLYE